MSEPCICRGLGYLVNDDKVGAGQRDIKDMIRPCPRCATEEQQAAMARRSGLEEREQAHTLKDWRIPALEPKMQVQRRQAKTVIQCAIEYKKGFYTFWGDFGAGKSLALQIVVNEVRAENVQGVYEPMSRILEHLRMLYGRHENTSRYWEQLLAVPVLAIDEVTRFNATEWSREKLFELVDTRYRRKDGHLTLFATNDDPTRSLPPEEALGYLYSRMREGKLVELRGDVRAIAAAQEE